MKEGYKKCRKCDYEYNPFRECPPQHHRIYDARDDPNEPKKVVVHSNCHQVHYVWARELGYNYFIKDEPKGIPNPLYYLRILMRKIHLRTKIKNG